MPARARGEQHEPVDTRGDRALDMTQGCHIGEDQHTGVVQRSDDMDGRPDAGDDGGYPMGGDDVEVGCQPGIRPVHDEVGDHQTRALLEMLQPSVDLGG